MNKCLLSLLFIFLLPVSIAAEEETSIEKIDWNLTEEEMVVTFLDLTSGEALLLQTGQGETILINTGGPQTREELLDRLEMFNVLKLDTVILTSLNKQYVSNLMWLNKSYLIDEIIVPSVFEKDWQTEFTFSNTSTQFWTTNMKIETKAGIIIKPVQMQYDGGMSLHLIFGKHDFLLMGAADKQMEAALLKKDPIHAEILKVAEFAKAEGTSEVFLERVDPQVAIIFRERKKLPSSDVLERLNETWIDIYQTRQFGNVAIRCDKENYEVMTFEARDEK